MDSDLRGLIRSDRGGILLSVLIILAIMAIMMSSYLKLSTETLRHADRSFYRIAAYNLAESGLEHGLLALRASHESSSYWYAWDAWTIDGDNAKIQLDPFVLEGSVSGLVNILVLNYNSTSPEVITKATIQPTYGREVVKYMYAAFDDSGGRRGLFSFGMLAREHITASGGARFDSWISDPDKDDATPAIPYSRQVARAQASVASASTDISAISLGSSDIFGSVAVGSESEYGLQIGWGGQVGPEDPNEWDEADTTDLWLVDGRKVSKATGALSTSFTASFESIEAPESTIILPAYSLPYQTEVPNSNGHGTQNTYVDEGTIGAVGEETLIEMPSLSIAAGSRLTIAGDVTLVLSSTAGNALNVGQGGGIDLADGAKLTIYTPGNIAISGAGFVHNGAPKQVQIWGTNSTGQEIAFSGSGSISGVIYAPNADISLPGGTDFAGAVVGRNITMSGSGSFHYDESLKDETGFGYTGGGNVTLSLQYMSELTEVSDWSPYADLLDF